MGSRERGRDLLPEFTIDLDPESGLLRLDEHGLFSMHRGEGLSGEGAPRLQGGGGLQGRREGEGEEGEGRARGQAGLGGWARKEGSRADLATTT